MKTTRPTRRIRWATWLGALCVLLLGVIAVIALQWANNVSHRLEHADHLADANAGALATANARLRQHSIAPVPTPSAGQQGQQGARGEKGDQGPPGPGLTDDQARAAVHYVCSSTPSLCQQPVSMSRLVSAVKGCFATNQCPAPKRGPSGASGASGQPGKDAPPVTEDQIIAGFAAYCSQQADRCRGPAGESGAPGKDGTNGTDGEDAPEITAIDCTGPARTSGLTFTYHFSNGVDIVVTCTPASPTDTPSPSGAPS